MKMKNFLIVCSFYWKITYIVSLVAVSVLTYIDQNVHFLFDISKNKKTNKIKKV